MTRTVTRTAPSSVNGPPPSTALTDPREGECPYLSADVVSLITGQRHGQSQVITVDELPATPICSFFRSDGGPMATIRVIRAASPASAVAAVNQHVPVNGSQPASQPRGWTGGSISHGPQVADAPGAESIYAVSKGKVAVVVQENESPSIKARSLAVCAIYGADLQPGDPPDFCLGAG